ncbi:uncharacterized protein KD926_008197 [Aspergillus affinis]|uniref:uncharacterized protein n=1 Tax=Aspergillus affinis TaxID=1070780 RepID=UPI0022FEF148|nr:uncharacterized protein KD926_008197 [Aspergillus affinis]KAI9040492.1 hypothetical protein KD926_008197 [Aspergillus affinis]
MRDFLFAKRTLFSPHLTTSIRSPLRHPLRFSSSTSRRETHGSGPDSKDPAIFNNSLWKTLEAHRSQNRNGLIRKVIFKNPPEEQYSLPENTAVVPEEQPSLEAHRSQKRNGFIRKIIRKGPPKKQPSLPTATPRRVLTSERPAYAKQKASTPSTTAGYSSVWEGEQVRWAASSKINRPEQSPWMAYVGGPRHAQLHGISQLDAEVRALDKYLSPIAQEQNHVAQVVTEVQDLIADTVPRPPLLIGPWRTGLAMSHSALEFVLPVPDSARSIERDRKPSATRPQVLQSYADLLRNVENALRRSSLFRDQIWIDGKPNPALTAIHRPTGLRLQFRCGEGPPSSIEYIRDYLAEYPSVRPLYMTSRLMLEARGLFSMHNHSITTNALVMLVVGFLKINHGRFRASGGSLGEQLLGFLQFYGTTVDLTTTGISVDPPGCFNAETVKSASKEYDLDDVPAFLRGQRALVNIKRTAASRGNVPKASRLCIQDPANYMNDLGRSCTRTSDLQAAFAHAYNLISAPLDKHIRPGESLLAPALQANFDDFSQVRARIIYSYRGSTATSDVE